MKEYLKPIITIFLNPKKAIINMGRIKSTLIKRTSRELLKKGEKFSEDFDENKKILSNSMPSKKIRNKIAGYIARLKKAERERKTMLEEQ